MKFRYKGVILFKKRIAITMGICLMTGSLSACGDDTTVTSWIRDFEKDAQSENQWEWEDGPIREEDLAQDLVDFVGEKVEEEKSEESEMTQVSEDLGQVSITISAAGDVTLGNYLTQDYAWSFRETYEQQNVDYFFENVYDIFAADDLTIVNLEGPLTTSEESREGEYIIKGEPEYVNVLTAGSVEAVSMANNHRLDYKEQGTKDTVEALERAGIKYAYDEKVGIFETKGIRIGLISVNEIGWGQGVERFIQDGIAQLQEQGVDLILASCHWGMERENYPEDYQKELGRKCIDWGVDLVIGHHPHVLQGIEEYQGKYIVYSLGNFCFGANRNPPDKDTMIFQQTFHFVDGERTDETTINIIPCSVSSITNRNDFKPTPATGGDAIRIRNRINEYSKEFGVEIETF